VLAKVLVLDPARLDGLPEAALVADDEGLHATPAWAAAVVDPAAP